MLAKSPLFQDSFGPLLMKVRRRPACRPVWTKLLMSLSQATPFQVEKVSITENHFAKLSGKYYTFLIHSSIVKPRKLSRLTCIDKYSLKAVEKRYPTLCYEVKHYMNINSCDQNSKWVVHEVSTNKSRDKLFEESILR